MHPQVAHHALDFIILQIAITAMNLQRLIGNIETSIGDKAFCHCRFTGLFSLAFIKRFGRFIKHQPRRFQIGRHICQFKLNGLKLSDGLTELLAGFGIFQRHIEGTLRRAQRTGGNVQAATIQPHHGEFKALAFFANAVLNRHAAIFKNHLCGRLIVPTHFLFIGTERKTRRAFFNNEATDALCPFVTGAHHSDINIGDAAAGNKRL